MRDENSSRESPTVTESKVLQPKLGRGNGPFNGFLGSIFRGSLKWGIRLAIAFILVGGLVAIIAWQATKKNEERLQKEQLRLSRPKTWPSQNFPGVADMKWEVTTRCNASQFGESGIELQFYASDSKVANLYSNLFNFNRGFTPYGYGDDLRMSTEYAPIVLTFLDRDGFEIARAGLQASDFTRIVDDTGAIVGVRAQGRFPIDSWKKYDAFVSCSILCRVPATQTDGR